MWKQQAVQSLIFLYIWTITTEKIKSDVKSRILFWMLTFAQDSWLNYLGFLADIIALEEQSIAKRINNLLLDQLKWVLHASRSW